MFWIFYKKREISNFRVGTGLCAGPFASGCMAHRWFFRDGTQAVSYKRNGNTPEFKRIPGCSVSQALL